MKAQQTFDDYDRYLSTCVNAFDELAALPVARRQYQLRLIDSIQRLRAALVTDGYRPVSP